MSDEAGTPARRRIPAQDFSRARAAAAGSGRRVIEVLEEQSGLRPEDFVEQLGSTLHFPVLAMQQLARMTPAFDVIAYGEAARRACCAVRDADAKLFLAFDDPFSADTVAWAEAHVALPFLWRLVHPGDLVAFLARNEEALSALDAVDAGASADLAGEDGLEDLSLRSISEDASEVVRLIRSTLRDAIKAGASDIHLETQANGLTIKFRIDGMLSQVKAIQDAAQAEQAISRIKVLAELDITERRVPQDGRFKARDHGRDVDFRVSIMPSIHGEDAVLRILDKESLRQRVHVLTLENLGFAGAELKALRKLSNEPYGMLLVTGPTGSGKTTTLYAAISEINHGSDKIITIEDPVEYQLPGVLQIPVNEKKGLTFAVGLRSILRHDPDKIMVGEIRDPETASIAIQSALTGHLVFTTVHANNVFDVIGRFMNMNVDLHSFVSALNGVLAQRLLRLLCPHCTEDDAPSPALVEDSGIPRAQAAGYRFRTGRGCRECRGTGFKGRTAIAEMLILNDELRDLIVQRASLRVLKEAALRSGTRFLRDVALDHVRDGRTALAEANRVTFVT